MKLHDYIDKYKTKLNNLGIYESLPKKTPFFQDLTCNDTYFDFLLNISLSGYEIDVDPNEVFDNMKISQNILEIKLAKLAEDYYSLQNELRNVKNDLEELRKDGYTIKR